MNWKQIYALSDPLDRTDEILTLFQIIEARQRRPAFLRKFYISRRMLWRSMPSYRIFVAMFISVPLHAISYRDVGFWAFAAIAIDFSMLFWLIFRRLRAELLKSNNGPLAA